MEKVIIGQMRLVQVIFCDAKEGLKPHESLGDVKSRSMIGKDDITTLL